MRFYSTKNKDISVSLREAVLKGIADDGGLFMPDKIPLIRKEELSRISLLSFKEIAFGISRLLLEPDVPEKDLEELINSTYNFSAPLVRLNRNFNVLELFHGPTLAFKDFGARFAAALVSYFIKDLPVVFYPHQ